MWVEPTRTALGAFEAAETEDQAFAGMVAFAADIGANLLSYHHLTPLTHKCESGTGFRLMSHGFPAAWVDHYQSSDYHRIDPITAYASGRMRPVLWSDVPHRVKLRPEQQAYMGSLYRWLSPGDGLAVPMFGPSGCHGYGGIGWTRPIPPWDALMRRVVQAVFESFHLRICELRLAELERDFELSREQLRILRRLARGETDAAIAELLDVDTGTLRQKIGAILTAMSVSDRPSALLRAQTLGLLGG